MITASALQLVPGFTFLGTFYWELKPEFKLWNQQFVPELNDDDPAEPYGKIQESFALALHYRNVAMDAIGVQAMWRTVSVREAFASQVESVGERMKGPLAASADLSARLVRRSSVPFELVQAGTLFYHTPDDPQLPSVEFESIDAVELTQRNDRIGYVAAVAPAGTLTDHTADAQDPEELISPAWGGSPTPAAGAMIYGGHQDVMVNEIQLKLATLGVRILDGAWEYYEGRYGQGTPSSVAQIAGGLRFVLTGFLGSKNRAGTLVRVLCAPTSVYVDAVVQYAAGAPTSVAIGLMDLSPRLRIVINSVVGAANVADGRLVRVRSLVSGEEVSLPVQWDGVNYVMTPTGDPYLGQGTPGSLTASAYWIDTGINYIDTTAGVDPMLGQDPASLDPYQYTVGSLWREFPDVVDDSALLCERVDADTAVSVSWTLPQNGERAWAKGAIAETGDFAAIEGFFWRLRITAVAAAGVVQPVIQAIDIDESEHWVLFPVTQGHSVDDTDAFSTTGEADQEMVLLQGAVIEATLVVTIKEPPANTVYEYTNPPDNSFYNSGPHDRHYILDSDAFGRVAVLLGDGVNGKVPRAASYSVTMRYRVMELADGNVSAESITETGVGAFDQVTNPRPATGFAYPEASTVADLARLKREIPARMRAGGNVVGADDAEPFAEDFVTAAGSKMAARAWLLEGETSTKVSRLILIGTGGVVSNGDLTELNDAINGSRAKKIRGKGVLNHRIVAENAVLSRVHIPVQATGGDEVAIQSALTALLSPLAKKKDANGKPTHDWQWEFGGSVPVAELVATVMRTTPRPTNVVLGGTVTGTLTGGDTITGATNAYEELNGGDSIENPTNGQRRKVASVAADDTITMEDAFDPALSAATGVLFFKGDLELAETALPFAGNITFPEA